MRGTGKHSPWANLACCLLLSVTFYVGASVSISVPVVRVSSYATEKIVTEIRWLLSLHFVLCGPLQKKFVLIFSVICKLISDVDLLLHCEKNT